jgi:hypothetical protein
MMMKKICIPVAAVCLVAQMSCRNQASEKTEETETTVADSTVTQEEEDTVFVEDSVVQAELPKAADELFDDFIFNFAQNKRIQLNRVQFPISLQTEGGTEKIYRKDWVHDKLFVSDDYYTIVLNNEKQLDLEKSTQLEHVNVDRINLRNNTLRRFVFERLEGLWRMTHVEERHLEKTEDSEFFAFYGNFVNDTVYQRQHLYDPITIVSSDTEEMDDGEEEMNGIISPEQWPDFSPEMATDYITSIDYGQHYKETDRKLVVKKGICNGMMDILTFRKVEGKWMLVKYEN